MRGIAVMHGGWSHSSCVKPIGPGTGVGLGLEECVVSALG